MSPIVRDNPEDSRYEVTVDSALAGFAEYYLHDGVIAFLHTEIDREFQGQGLATVLIRAALDDARSRDLSVQPFCPFVRSFVKEHADYADLVREDEWVRFGLAF